jgi:hypothetical protein
MAQNAPTRINQYSLENVFEAFWRQHLITARGPINETPDAKAALETAAAVS